MRRTVGIVGAGRVGSAVAISLLHSGITTELLINDLRPEVAEGEALDLAQGAPFYPSAKVRAASIAEMRYADAVIVCAGRGGRPGENRLQLLQDNISIVESIARQLVSFEGIVLIVSNPVDILTKVFVEASRLPFSKVIGTGTMLDTARLRHALGQELGIGARSIHAHIVGEHGDSQVVLWSGARVGGTLLSDWPGWSPARGEAIAEEVKSSAQYIICRKGPTQHAIGLATAALLRRILRGERRFATVSCVQEQYFPGIALSLPTLVSADGVSKIVLPKLSTQEEEGLAKSVAVLQGAMEGLREESGGAALPA